jgi:hypothetical protein
MAEIPPSASSGLPPTGPALHAPAAGTGASRIWPFAIIAAALAGLASFAVAEAIHQRYAVVNYTDQPQLDPREFGMNARPLAERMQEVKYATNDAIYCYGALGALLGLALGLAGGLAGGAKIRTLIAAIGGMLLGMMAGVGTSAGLLPPIFAPGMSTGVKALAYDSVRVMIMHGSIWGAIGAAAGLALAFGWAGTPKMPLGLIGGLLGGILAAILYNVIGGFAFPATAEAYRPVAMELPARLAAHLAVALLVGLCATFLLTSLTISSREKPAAAPPPPA